MKIPYARAFHEANSIFCALDFARLRVALIWAKNRRTREMHASRETERARDGGGAMKKSLSFVSRRN